MKTRKLIRITTVPISLKILLKGQHRFMSQNGFEVVGVSAAGQELQDVAADEDIRVIALEMTRTISPFRDLQALWRFYKLCKREKPAMVHSHTPKAGIVGMLGAKLAGVPVRLHTVAGLPLMEVTGLKRRLLDFVEKLTYRCATRVYPNSKGLYDFILGNRYTSVDKLHVIASGSSNGIDTAFFAPEQISQEHRAGLKQELGISEEDFTFIFVGRLVGDKGVNELVAAFSRIPQLHDSTVNQFYNSTVPRFHGSTIPRFHDSTTPRFHDSTIKLLLVGPLEANLDPLHPDTLTEITSNPNIIQVGFQKDVRPYFAVSDALVFPSYREGFPNVVMQAGAMGLPGIVSDINGCNEIIQHEVNGKIVPAKNVDALVVAMEQMIQDPENYRVMQSNARKMIRNRYEQQVVWEALLNEYRRLLAEKP